MKATPPSRLASRLAAAAVVAALLSSDPVSADMIPLQDIRENSADVTFLGITAPIFDYPSAPFARFESYATPVVYNPDPEGAGHCEATAYQLSQFLPTANGISASGFTRGGWQILPGTYNALSHAEFEFRLDYCHQYQLDAWLTPGDVGESRIGVDVPNVNLAYESTTAGEIHTTGRLPAGEYSLKGHSYIQSDAEFTEGAAYSILWTCVPCVTTLIAGDPLDQTVACGGTAVFSVNPTLPHDPLTYQWRRNMIPLTDNGQIAGATTATLTVNNACDADAGRYDVVVSDGTIVQPSRLAQLRMATTTSVDDLPVGAQRPFSLEVTGPNPFGRSTSFRYSMARPQIVTIDIYNAVGAKVRSLSRGLATGSGTVTWDGNANSGSRAPAGIYFLRFEAGNARESRKVVLLR